MTKQRNVRRRQAQRFERRQRDLDQVSWAVVYRLQGDSPRRMRATYGALTRLVTTLRRQP